METEENEAGYVCYVWSQSKLNKYLPRCYNIELEISSFVRS